MSDPDADSPEADAGTATGTDAGLAGGPSSVRQWLVAVRADPDRRRTVQTTGAVVGLVLATAHPIGLVVGGVLVGLPAADLRRAVGAGAAFGVLALATFVLTLAVGGGLGGYLAMGTITAVSVGAALVLPVVGSLARGAV